MFYIYYVLKKIFYKVTNTEQIVFSLSRKLYENYFLMIFIHVFTDMLFNYENVLLIIFLNIILNILLLIFIRHNIYIYIHEIYNTF